MSLLSRVAHRSFNEHATLLFSPWLPVRLVLVLLLSLVCVGPAACQSIPHQQHNVWYNGLFISGIAVDESTGDVFFSDAAGNRVVHQSRNGSVVHVYDKCCSFYSPMQLEYSDGQLYVADSNNARVVVIDVQSGDVSSSAPTSRLSSCSALSINVGTGDVIVADGWGLTTEAWTPAGAEVDGGSWSYFTDLSIVTPRPNYLSSISAQSYVLDDGLVIAVDPTQSSFYLSYGHAGGNVTVPLSFNPLMLGVTSAVGYTGGDPMGMEYLFLSQAAADEPLFLSLYHNNGTLDKNWTAPGRGGAAIPFYGWAMYVDSGKNMYVGSGGMSKESSPYGRVVKLAPNGTELSEWSMSDGTVHSFSSVRYVAGTELGHSCAYWMADTEKGMVRVAADGSVLLPFYDAPVDPADNRTARLTGIAGSDSASISHANNHTLVLLDTSDNTTTKLWRFLPYNHSYMLLNTSAANLGPNIAGSAVNTDSEQIYLSDTWTRLVIRLNSNGQLDTSFDTSGAGLVVPAGIALLPSISFIAVADSGLDEVGALLLITIKGGERWKTIHSTGPSMFRPLSVTYDAGGNMLYVADSNGYVFQFYVLKDFQQVAAHHPVPTASSIVSMTVSAQGYVYMIDSFSRRLIVLSRQSTGWDVGDRCIPSMSSSSSSSSAAATSTTAMYSSASSWSSSSSASTVPTGHPQWSTTTFVGAAMLGLALVAAAGGAGGCYYMKWKRSRGSGGPGRGAVERLLSEQDQQVYEEKHETVRVDNGREAVELPVNEDEHVVDGGREADMNEQIAVTSRRYDYYVARYEVVVAIGNKHEQQLGDSRHHEPTASAGAGQPLSIRIPKQHLDLPSGASTRRAHVSPATATTATAGSFSSNSNLSSSSGDYLSSASSGRATPTSRASTMAVLLSPPHIASLHSAWRTTTAPTFIDSVTDLTILGEGSSGVVYRGDWRGTACVVKLPKSEALTGAAWREWQCHLSLPAHPNLVHFLGALPMASTKYLVLGLVRQGSLHSLLASSDAKSGASYSRPYGVMRCVRDMSAVLVHMHEAGIVHRDVSCRNILVDSDGSMVLADLGLATLLIALDDSTQQTAVPVRWTSPEALASSTYSSKSDVWSLGVALWELTASGALPYGKQQRNTKACIRPIIAGHLTLHVDDGWGRDDRWSRAEQLLANIVRRLILLCLTHDAERRPDSGQLKALVEKWWEEWQVDAGYEAKQLERGWLAYHDALQQRLEPATSHQPSNIVT